MSRATLGLSPGPDSRVFLELSDSEGGTLETELSSECFSGLLQLLDELEGRGGDSWSGDADRTMRDHERATAEYMGRALCGDERVRARLAWLARAADAEGRPLTLCLEIADVGLSRLPWELVAGAGKGSSPLSGAQVLRKMSAEDWLWAETGNRLEIYCSGPYSSNTDLTDPGGLGEGLADLEAVQVFHLEVDPPGETGGHPYRVHHCRLLAGGQISLETSSPPEGIALTVVELLASGDFSESLSPQQAWLLGNGGPVICARRPMLGGVGVVAWDSLYRAIAGGLGLVEAVEAVRDGLRLLSQGHKEARWWSPMLLVPGGEPSRVPPPLSVGTRLQGAPRGSPEGEAVLGRARELGSRVGYLGVEHLAQAIVEHDSSHPLVSAARPGLSYFLDRIEELPGSPGVPRATPRFLAILEVLTESFGPLDLLKLLVRVRWLSLSLDPFLVDRLLREGSGEEIGDGLSSEEAENRRLVVEGGPEDGRVIHLKRAGLVIGRWDPARPDLREGRLFIDSSCVDRSVSRSAMTWLGGDWIELGSELRMEREDAPLVRVSGRMELNVGDRFWLGGATCLRFLG